MGVKPFTKTNQSYILVSTIILILILLTFFLLQSPFTSSLSINSKSKATPKTPYPGCLQPISISQDRYPLDLYGSNLLYTNLININGTLYPEPDKLFIWNIGPDHKPNTADDLNPVEINATGIILTGNVINRMGDGENYGDIHPKISDRYIVWASTDGFNHNINVIDMGVDGILNQLEALNSRVIYSVFNQEIDVNSINLKGSRVSFTYNSKMDVNNPISPKVGFCDLNLISGAGSCSQGNVITFDAGVYDESKMTGDAYFYLDQNQNIQVLFGEITYSHPRDTHRPVNYSIFSWNQNSGVNLVYNQIELIDLYESLAIVSYATVPYQTKIYGYFHPSIIPLDLIPLSNPNTVRSRTLYPKVNSRNSFSPLGNYLTTYTRGPITGGGGSSLYIGSLGGRAPELQTPFNYSYRPLLDSSPSGNHLYTYQNNTIYYTQCFGI